MIATIKRNYLIVGQDMPLVNTIDELVDLVSQDNGHYYDYCERVESAVCPIGYSIYEVMPFGELKFLGVNYDSSLGGK